MDDAGQQRYDVVVIGGGAAGLSGALALARARRSVLVVDGGEPRNRPASHVHNYLGREGTPPAELLALGRAEVAAYGGAVVTGGVASVAPVEGVDGAEGVEVDAAVDRRDGGIGFRLVLDDGTSIDARRLLVTTGLVDDLPDVPGVAERWGRDVLHCPYCHGWEVRDRALGVLATGPMAVHQALLFRQWSDDVTLLTHVAPPAEEELEQLAARGIRVVTGEVAGLQVDADRLTGVRLSSGDVVPLEAVVVAPVFRARADLLVALGLPLQELQVGEHVIATYVAADAQGATPIPGVWVAGNVADPRAQVITAAAAGLTAAAALNADLVTEDTRLAVAAARRQRAVAAR